MHAVRALALLVLVTMQHALAVAGHIWLLEPPPVRWGHPTKSFEYSSSSSSSSSAGADDTLVGCTNTWAKVSDLEVAACCRYEVTRQPVTSLRGAVPGFVNGTLYHAVSPLHAPPPRVTLHAMTTHPVLTSGSRYCVFGRRCS